MSTEYSNGYWGKIEYWTAELKKSVDNNNLCGVERAFEKLDYFIQQQWDTNISVYGTFKRNT
jgi:hypothetical protein